MDEQRLTLHDHELAAVLTAVVTERAPRADREAYMLDRLRRAASNANAENRRVRPMIDAAALFGSVRDSNDRCAAHLRASAAVCDFFYWRSLIIMDEITARQSQNRGAA
ncbi:hypothetical protein [Seohaeicola zhoushanensis]|uniref:Uncharacterized protein n=1 Tax=Seohaeicola zhoushanensis TaxID=1569283 RepID=A0A8J3GTF9_9RHOB|nr:hypothetical protein [Seohaeicola zhoushanensis]GHF33159.1 hypothetical protein GCM10017056_00710 [Seohaeicola zhoushanensis]